MAWTEPIIDRKQSDLDNNTAKAFMNYSHYNEIISNIKYLISSLKLKGYYISGYKELSDVSVCEALYKSSADKLTDDIKHIYDEYAHLANINTPPITLDKLNIVKANDLENVLLTTYNCMNSIEDNQIYCGDYNCGEWLNG